MKAKIIAHAIDYLLTHDLNTFTLALAAEKAGVSKGGLLHHFKTKQDLLDQIADAIFDDFLTRLSVLQQTTAQSHTTLEAFVLASQEDLLAGAKFNIAITILEGSHSDLSQRYALFTEKLADEAHGLSDLTPLMVRLVIDGLYYSNYLKLAPVSTKETELVFEQLLALIRKKE